MCALCKLACQYIHDCALLLVNPYGDWKESMLADEDLAADINLYLQEIGKDITAEKLALYLGHCEVSEHATHRSSPHGPCEPSARVTGRARTYATDVPKRDSTLLEAASELDQCSPPSASSPLPLDLAPPPSSPRYGCSPTTRTLNDPLHTRLQ
jgi:hypothetical protein